jgi:hypothetical protein
MKAKIINNQTNTAMLGYAEVNITPTMPVQTIGFGRQDNLARGILHDLFAQISVWQYEEAKNCLVAIDHIGFSKEHADALRDKIGELLSIPKEKVMLCFSHTHSAPNESIEQEYFSFLCNQVKAGVRKAAGQMLPVMAAWGNAFADIGLNRRLKCTALDRRIGILKVTDAGSGKLIMLLLRLTAHANVLKADNYLISPDYFGAVRDLLQEKFKCPIMLTQGAAGNVAPKYFHSDLTPPDACDARFIRSKTALHDMAFEIYKQVKKTIDRINSRCVNHLTMYSQFIELFADVPSYEEALQIAREAKKEADIDGTAWLGEVQRLIANGVHKQADMVEIQYFAVDDGCLCGVANEIMCEFALRAKECISNDFFYLGGYTNGCTGYFPTEEAYDQGGYEVYWSMLQYYIYHGRVFPLNRDSASQLIHAAAENIPHYMRQ